MTPRRNGPSGTSADGSSRCLWNVEAIFFVKIASSRVRSNALREDSMSADRLGQDRDGRSLMGGESVAVIGAADTGLPCCPPHFS
jgi:hypothetical protein